MAKGADQVEVLVNNNVQKEFYAVTGDSLIIFERRRRRSGKINMVHVRHETVGALCRCCRKQNLMVSLLSWK